MEICLFRTVISTVPWTTIIVRQLPRVLSQIRFALPLSNSWLRPSYRASSHSPTAIVSLRVCVILAYIDKKRPEMANVGGMPPLSPTCDRTFVRYKNRRAFRISNPQSQSQFWVLFLFDADAWHSVARAIATTRASAENTCFRDDDDDGTLRPFRALATQRGDISLFSSFVQVKIYCARYNPLSFESREELSNIV